MLSGAQKESIEILVFECLETRERYTEFTLAQMYDPEMMPSDLVNVHSRLDSAVESLYRKQPFADGERLAYLLSLYKDIVVAGV